MKGSWLKAMIVSLVLVSALIFSTFFGDIVSLITGIRCYGVPEFLITAFLVSPLLLGVVRFFWRETDDINSTVGDAFCYFSSKRLYLRAVTAFFALFLRVFVIVFVCLVPYMILNILTSVDFYSLLGVRAPGGVFPAEYFTKWFRILGVAASIPLLTNYLLAPAIIVANDSISVNEAFKLSRRVSVGKLGYYLTFLLSFAGWLLLSVLAFPIIFTLPYFLASYCVFSRFVITNNNLMAEHQTVGF